MKESIERDFQGKKPPTNEQQTSPQKTPRKQTNQPAQNKKTTTPQLPTKPPTQPKKPKPHQNK